MKINITKSMTAIMACLVLTTFLISCKDNDDAPATVTPAATTAAQDKGNVEASIDLVADDAVAILKTEGVKAMGTLVSKMDKSPAFGKQASLSTQIGAKVKGAIMRVAGVFHYKSKSSAKTAEAGLFDFAGNVGTYTWNFYTKAWDSTKGTPSDKVILNFPSDSTGTVNNAQITITTYTENSFPGKEGEESKYVPTRLVANLTIDATTFASVDYTGTFNSDGGPVAINLNLFVKPFTLAIAMNNQTTTVTADLSLSKEGETAKIVALNGTLVFVDATQKDIKTVEANLSLKQLNLKGNANVAAIQAAEHGGDNIALLNDNIKLAISHTGTKIGDLKFVTALDSSGMEQTQAVILFSKDNTTVKAETYFEKLGDKIKKQIEESGFDFGKK